MGNLLRESRRGLGHVVSVPPISRGGWFMRTRSHLHSGLQLIHTQLQPHPSFPHSLHQLTRTYNFGYFRTTSLFYVLYPPVRGRGGGLQYCIHHAMMSGWACVQYVYTWYVHMPGRWRENPKHMLSSPVPNSREINSDVGTGALGICTSHHTHTHLS
jgi:hypothetical protein